MTPSLLVLNAGSSSIKFSLFPADKMPSRNVLICEGQYEGLGHQTHFTVKNGVGKSLANEPLNAKTTHEDALAALLAWLAHEYPDCQLVAAGHRVVHGGAHYTAPVAIDEHVISELRRLVPLAPLHQPHHLTAIAALSKLHPALPQFACFDTAFHHTQPGCASAFALPRRLTDGGIRRYGFHGLSYEYIASVLPEAIGPSTAEGRVIVAHLGNGASMCAMYRRKSVATTMGFTALDGLPMGQRCGTLDPGVVLYLMQEKGMSATQISDLLYQTSGLLGVSGVSNDMRVLLASNNPHAQDAIDLFVYRAGRELGSLAAALGGLDALIFTAGIGEHAVEIRRRICLNAAWLGIQLDEARNAGAASRITKHESKVSAWVIPTDEDLMIAQQSWSLIDDRNRDAN